MRRAWTRSRRRDSRPAPRSWWSRQPPICGRDASATRCGSVWEPSDCSSSPWNSGSNRRSGRCGRSRVPRQLFDEDGFHPRPGRIGLFLAAAALWITPLGSAGIVASSVPIVELASMPVMLVLYQLMLRARLLAGGADAKCLMALTLLVPAYPNASPFPVFTADPRVQPAFQALFPFSFVVLVDAAVLQLVVPLGLFIYNVTRGDVGIQSFLGYRAPLDPFPKHVRLMERITDRGEHVVVLRPKRDLDPIPEILKLRAAGIRRAWVTPWIPFMVPLLGGFLLAFFAGNVLVAVLGVAR